MATEKQIIFYFLNQAQIAQARLQFQQLNVIGPETGDWFFSTYGPGNATNNLNVPDRPYERFNDYESLLSMLQNDNPEKYSELHKGTPFYFLFWTAFQLGDYDKALFYIDAALSEDESKFPDAPITDWLRNPAGQFLTLDHQGNQVARELTVTLIELLEEEFHRFNRIPELPPLDISSFKDKFVLPLSAAKSTRSIVTTFYLFLLEFLDRKRMILLRSCYGGSLEPILSHLFKGGLVFESLLKQLYSGARTIGGFNSITDFVSEFCKISTTSEGLEEIVSDINGNDLKTAFDTTAKLRNTTGHNLVWTDVFNNPGVFIRLHQQIVNAIFYIIVKKYISSSVQS